MESSRPSRDFQEKSLLLAGCWLALLLLTWVVGNLVVHTLSGGDLSVLNSVAAVRTTPLTTLSHAFSFLASGFFVVPATVVGCVTLYWSGQRADAIALGLSVAGASALSGIDKLLVSRPRPPLEHLEAVGSASFPSGHSTSAAALYLALLLVLLRSKPRKPVALTCAIVVAALMAGVALSRVYLGVHYPSDVVAGLLLGGTWTVVVAAVVTGRPGGLPIRRRQARGRPPTPAGAPGSAR